MSESSPPVPPSRGSPGRSLLVVAIVMALGVVGLLLFKASRDEGDEQAPVARTPPSQAKKAPPPSAEPPPPPPPPEVEEPEPEPEKAAPKPAAPRNTACTGECSGAVTPELTRTLTGKARQARSCYNRALSQNSSLSGKLLVGVRVGSGGQACSASVVSDTLGDATVSRCVLSRFRSGKYPRPSGGCLDLQVPINFTAPE